MTYIRRIILSLALIAGITPAIAQVPPPVPALPDTERRTAYQINASTCACNVNFALYGDSTDYQDWLEVWVNGVMMPYNDPAFGWTITSPTGPLANIARPITNAVLTFTNAQTGTVQIVGARRPRRTSQFNEGVGVPTRNFNVVLSDIVAMLREVWDKINDVTGRVPRAPPGETMTTLPPAASRANMGACFDTGGNLVPCVGSSAGSFSAGTGIAFTGTNPTTISIGSNGIVTGVAGGSTTFIPSQCGANVVRTNSGAVMQDLLPGTGAGVLANNCKVTVTNGDASAMQSIAAASGTSIRSGTASNGFVYLGPGQSATFQSDGSTYWTVSSPTRAKLGANTTVFISATGSNSNDGLTAATPFATHNFAYGLVKNSFDVAGLQITFSTASGTYPFIQLSGPLLGATATPFATNVVFQGDLTTPDNVIIAGHGSNTIQLLDGVIATFQGFKVTNSVGHGIDADSGSIMMLQNLDMAAVGSVQNHIISTNNAQVTIIGNYTISANAGCEWIASQFASITVLNISATVTITLTGTPAWATGFACAQYPSMILINTTTAFSGSATGPRFNATLNGVVSSSTGGNTNFFPGSTAGGVAAGGQYN